MTNSLTIKVSRHFGSLQLSGLMLIALLHRTPVLRMLAAAESVWVSSSLGQVLKASAAVATMLGAVDTLAGATSLVTNPGSPAGATVGESFSAVFAYTGGPTSPESYSIAGLPAGLTVPGSSAGTGGMRVLNGTSGTITGIPTQEGTFNVTITAFDGPNLTTGSHGSAASVYTIIVEAGSVSVAPAITSQPSSLTVTAGQSASFSVTATGDPAPTFQWRKGGVNINGATSSTFMIASTVSGDAGTYTVFVSNGVGPGVTSNGATLTVNAAAVAPAISTHPVSQTVTAGQQVSFSVAATGTAPLTYQWRKGGVNINGATSATYTIPSAAGADAGTYSVVVTNTVNSATSNGATLTVNPAPVAPAISTHPLSQTVTAGQQVSFSVEATGTAPLTYQWRKGGVNINGATSATYTIPSAADADAGTYSVVVTNTVNSATSNGATLTVNAAPAAPLITTQPESQTVNAGDSVTFTAAASGNPAPTYQWRKNGVDIIGATNSSLTLSGVTAGDAANYTVAVSNASGSAISNIAQLLVIIPPSNAVISITVE